MATINPDARLPIDPDVKVPAAVARAAARAEAVHHQAYDNPPEPQPAPTPPPAPVAQPAPQAEPQPVAPPAQQPLDAQPAPQPVPSALSEPYPGKDAQLGADQWRHQYLSMKGRYEQLATSMGSMQEQMSEMGDELMRTQAALRQNGPLAQPQPQPQAQITDRDREVYGPELLDLIERAVRQTTGGDFQNINATVQNVARKVQQNSVRTVHSLLAEAVPDWAAINVNPRFKAWCRLPDVYSGQVRGNLLNTAFQAADAPRVIAFFKGFLQEELATGQVIDPQQQPAANTPARQAAMGLDQLTAPGRAKPASSDTQTPAEKPIFTRQQIAAFYADVRRQAYAGRETEKNAFEQAIFLAQKEGRVR